MCTLQASGSVGGDGSAVPCLLHKYNDLSRSFTTCEKKACVEACDCILSAEGQTVGSLGPMGQYVLPKVTPGSVRDPVSKANIVPSFMLR